MDIKARVPGTLKALKVSVGDAVKKGDIVAIMEAMKMEQVVPATVDGAIKEIKAAEGDKLKAGAVILVIE
jgi:biotin carboxyl carrier protein